MADLSQSNPTGRFAGLAAVYARCRPDYPAQAVDFILTYARLAAGATLVDVGSGTGISSRLLAQRGLSVIGIEPNADMRSQAQDESSPADLMTPVYREGRAEATGLPAACADAVLAAQAFHWFEAESALAEFQRILRPSGAAALLWNERDESDPFTAAYGAAIRTAPDTAVVEGARGRAGEPLLIHPLFHDAQQIDFAHIQYVDEEGLLGRAFSASYAPREEPQARAFASVLRDVFQAFQKDNRVGLRYRTSLTIARRLPRL